MKTRRLLLTAFEPFGGKKKNASKELLDLIAASDLTGFQISKAVLPVSFRSAPKVLKKVIAQTKPDAIICLGEADKRSTLQMERIAVNFGRSRIPDNDGKHLGPGPILKNAPAGYFSNLPIEFILQKTKKKKLAVTDSLSAGSYVCNHVFFHLMHELRSRPKVKAGFIHVTATLSQNQKALSRAKMALLIILSSIKF